MKVAIVTWGSRGDYQPYLALALAFRKAGHEVRLGVQPAPGFARLAASHGIELIPLSSELGDAYRKTIDRAVAMGKPVEAVRLFLDDLLLPAFDEMYAGCAALAQWSDVVVSHFLQIAGAMAAESTGRPYVSGTLVPNQIPNDSRPPGTFPNLGPRANRTLWKMAGAYMNATWIPPVNQARKRVGLAPLAEVARNGFYSQSLNLVAMSPEVFPRPESWAPAHVVTGYWALETPADFRPSPELVAFLEEHPPPVAFDFGSMTSGDGSQLTDSVLRAVEKAQVPAILDPAMVERLQSDLPPGVLAPEAVPHSWLLERVACLVHHGGAGTSAAAFRSGAPSVFIPHAFDQHEWAQIARDMGLSPEPVPLRKATVDRLVSALQAVQRPELRRAASDLGTKLRREDGAAYAVELVEEYVRTGSPHFPVN